MVFRSRQHVLLLAAERQLRHTKLQITATKAAEAAKNIASAARQAYFPSMTSSVDLSSENERLVRPALIHGLQSRCPACGEGKLFSSFLTPAASCTHCSEDLEGHEAHDFPAYIVILILGHVIVSVMMTVNAAFNIPVYWQAIIWPVVTIVLALSMIQPVKGAVIAYQWAKRMHGFAKQS